ncbi:MAG: hypothetical protein LC799_15525, partial [Actinobacteria bacterium]|nr:hypothetical protein [Actinomycetota bacterium]
MEIDLHIADFTWPGGPAGLADDLARVAVAAEEAGFARVSVMDHLWQIGHLGPPEHEMLEAYKLDVLREHCEREDRNYDEIEKTVMFPFDLGKNGEKVDDTIETLRGLAKLGIQEA